MYENKSSFDKVLLFFVFVDLGRYFLLLKLYFGLFFGGDFFGYMIFVLVRVKVIWMLLLLL